MIVDAEGQILGRLASQIAQKLLDGEEVKVTNSEKAIITGNRDDIVGKYIKRNKAGDPHHGPFRPSSPDGILRRTVRGMLPMKKSRGEEAYAKLKTYPGNPGGEEGKKIAKNEGDITTNFITLGKLSESLSGE